MNFPSLSPAGLRASGIAPPILAFLGSIGAVWALWRVFLETERGQIVDETVWDGVGFLPDKLTEWADTLLSVMAIPFLVVVIIAAILVAVAQRRWSIGIAAAIVIGGANGTTQLLKRIIERPDFDISYLSHNSFPSGHATMAAALAATAVLISPHRLRGGVSIVAFIFASLAGISTIIVGWHRPSDVAAGYVIAGAWFFIMEAARSVFAKGPVPRGYKSNNAANAAGALTVFTAVGIGLGGGVLAAMLVGAPNLSDLETKICVLGSLLGMVGVMAGVMRFMVGMRPQWLKQSIETSVR